MEPPPPYGAVKPLNHQSPLGIAGSEPRPTGSTDERPVIPAPAISTPPNDAKVPEPELDANAFPPFKKRPNPKPDAIPSPFAPKEPTTTPEPATNAKPDTKLDTTTTAKNLTEIKTILTTANAAWKAVDTYEATLTRRERDPQGAEISEVVLFQFRREPMSVFTRNISEAGKGREVVYNPSKHGDKLYLMIGQGDHKLFKAGFIVPPVSPDDPRVKEKARYSIRDAGFGKNLAKLSEVLAKIEGGKLPADRLTYLGDVKRNEYAYPLRGIAFNMRPGDDPLFPNGGTRTYFFDMKEKSPSYGLPVVMFATDSNGKEAEYYLFENVKNPANLTDADFNPDRMGKKK
jgi:hypothetical protein